MNDMDLWEQTERHHREVMEINSETLLVMYKILRLLTAISPDGSNLSVSIVTN